MRALAIGGWIVIVTALFTWQAIGLVRTTEWPTMSDMLRAFMEPVVGRWLLFGLWLWIGWHLFVRGREWLLG
jgi:hypothetical protein